MSLFHFLSFSFLICSSQILNVPFSFKSLIFFLFFFEFNFFVKVCDFLTPPFLGLLVPWSKQCSSKAHVLKTRGPRLRSEEVGLWEVARAGLS